MVQRQEYMTTYFLPWRDFRDENDRIHPTYKSVWNGYRTTFVQPSEPSSRSHVTRSSEAFWVRVRAGRWSWRITLQVERNVSRR